jgi:hypothetical protein
MASRVLEVVNAAYPLASRAKKETSRDFAAVMRRSLGPDIAGSLHCLHEDEGLGLTALVELRAHGRLLAAHLDHVGDSPLE